MLGKKVKSRIYLFVFIIFLTTIGLYVFLRSLDENIIYFLSPTEIYKNETVELNKKIRIGGMVKKNSLKKKKKSINFIITDYDNEIYVTYSGSIPNLFAEGKGVVAEGKLRDKKYFIADKILAKHDENYMPPEVSKILKKTKE